MNSPVFDLTINSHAQSPDLTTKATSKFIFTLFPTGFFQTSFRVHKSGAASSLTQDDAMGTLKFKQRLYIMLQTSAAGFSLSNAFTLFLTVH
jgi:hypothetical protein